MRFWVRLHYFATNMGSHQLATARGHLLNVEGTEESKIQKGRWTGVCYNLCNESSDDTNFEMNGERAERNALAHSSCGR